MISPLLANSSVPLKAATVALGVALTILDRCRQPAEVTDLRLRLVRLESDLIDVRARVGELYVEPGKVEQR